MVPADAGIRPAIERSKVDLPDPVRPSSPTICPCDQLQLDAVEHQKLAAVGARKGLAQPMDVEKRVCSWGGLNRCGTCVPRKDRVDARTCD